MRITVICTESPNTPQVLEIAGISNELTTEELIAIWLKADYIAATGGEEGYEEEKDPYTAKLRYKDGGYTLLHLEHTGGAYATGIGMSLAFYDY